MKKHTPRTQKVLATLLLTATLQQAHAANIYWDSNSSTTGAGATPNGTWGSDSYWNTSSTGGAGTFTAALGTANTGFFSAGTDAVNAYTVTVVGTQTAGGLTFEDGTPKLTGGTIALSAASTITASANLAGTATIESALTVNTDVAGTNLTLIANDGAAATDLLIKGAISATTPANTYQIRLGGAGNGRIEGAISNHGTSITQSSGWTGTWTIAGNQNLGSTSLNLTAANNKLVMGDSTSDVQSWGTINSTSASSVLTIKSTATGGVVSLRGGGGTMDVAGVFNGTGFGFGLTGTVDSAQSGVLKLSGGSATFSAAGSVFSIYGTGNKIIGGATSYGTLTMANTSGLTLGTGLVLGGAGTYENNLNLVVAGPNKLTLSAANTYTGTTTVKSGILALDATGSIANSSNIVVGDATAASSAPMLDLTAKGSFNFLSGQTVSGTGTLNIGSGKTITVDSGAHWAPGNSIGTNAVTGNLTLSGISDFQLGNSTGSGTRLSPYNSDRTNVSGTLTLGGTLNLLDNAAANSNGVASAGSYLIFTYGSVAGTLSGSFGGISNLSGSGYHAKVVNGGAGTGSGQGIFLDNYQIASANALSNVNFANFHVGATLSSTQTLTNGASASFGEGLSVTSSTSGGATVGGVPGTLIAGGGSAQLIVGIANTAGVKGGTVGLTLNSDGAGTSGYGTTALTSQNITVTGTGYRLATVNTLGDANIGNFHVGKSQNTIALSATNTQVSSDIYSEKLDLSGAATGATFSGASLIAAGSSSSLTFGVSDTAGTHSGSVVVSATSNGAGTSGLGLTSVGSQTVNVNGTGYRLATVNTLGDVSVGNFHVGKSANTVSLSASNTQVNTDAYSEKLDLSGSAGGLATFSGAATGIAAGSSTSLTFGVSDTAGTHSGTVVVSATYNGAGTSGLGLTSVGSQTVNVSGAGYNLASAATAQTVNLGIIHKNQAKSAAVSLTNTAPTNATYTETLQTNGFTGTTAGFTASGSVLGLAGQASGTGTLSVGIGAGFSTVGEKSGTTTLALQSNEVNGSGLGTTSIGNQVITMNVQVNEYASPTFTKASGDGTLTKLGSTSYTLDFGSFNLATGKTATLDLTNYLLDPTYQDLLNGTFNVTGTGFTIVSGGNIGSDIAINGSHSITIGFDTLTTGGFTGQLTFNPTSVNTSGTSSMAPITMDLQAMVVPEPATWAMMIGGLGMLGFAQRLRRRANA